MPTIPQNYAFLTNMYYVFSKSAIMSSILHFRFDFSMIKEMICFPNGV